MFANGDVYDGDWIMGEFTNGTYTYRFEGKRMVYSGEFKMRTPMVIDV